MILALALVALPACRSDPSAETVSWDIEGQLLAMDTDIWIVDAVPIVVPDAVAADQTPVPGDIVIASGRFDASGLRVAEAIEFRTGTVTGTTLPSVTLDGAIEHIDGRLWQIDGQEVIVTDQSVVRSDGPETVASTLVQAGNIAEVTGYRLPDSRILASIVVLRAPPESPAQADAQPSSTSIPDVNQPEPATTDEDDSHAETQDGDTPDETSEATTEDEHSDDGEHDNHTKEKPEKKDKPDKPEKPDKDKKEKH